MKLEAKADNSVDLLDCVVRSRYLDTIKVLDTRRLPVDQDDGLYGKVRERKKQS